MRHVAPILYVAIAITLWNLFDSFHAAKRLRERHAELDRMVVEHHAESARLRAQRDTLEALYIRAYAAYPNVPMGNDGGMLAPRWTLGY